MSTVQNTVFDCDQNSMNFRCTFDPSAKEVTEEAICTLGKVNLHWKSTFCALDFDVLFVVIRSVVNWKDLDSIHSTFPYDFANMCHI